MGRGFHRYAVEASALRKARVYKDPPLPREEGSTACSIALGKSLGVCQSRSCKIIYRGTGLMRDESTKQAAQEYLAAKLTEEEQIYEETHNVALAVARAPLVWKSVKDA